MEVSSRKQAFEGICLLLVSLVFYSFDMLVFLYIVPLLLFALRGGKRKAELLLLLAAFAVLVIEILSSSGLPWDKQGIALLLISLYFPWSLSAAGVVWLETEHDHRLIRRLVCALLPSLLFLFVIALFIATDRALLQGLVEIFENALAALMGNMLEQLMPGLEMSVLSELVLLTVLCLVVPLLLVSVCACCFIYSCGKHSREGEWEWSVMTFEYPSNAVWGLIIAWALVLLLHFVSVPEPLLVVVMNLALAECVLYAIEGFTVVFAWVRKRNQRVKSLTVFVVLFVAAIALPGINFIIVLGLPLLGILEAFFDLKKIGVEYEDHS